MLNYTTIIGRLVRDPEKRATNGGSQYCNITLAYDTYSNKEKTTNYINAVAFSFNAQTLAKYGHKGDLIGIGGELIQSSYKTKEGVKVSYHKVLIRDLQLLSWKKSEEIIKDNSEYQPIEQELDIDGEEMPF